MQCDAMIAFLSDGYRYDGTVVVGPEPGSPIFFPAAAGERPGFDTHDRIMLFERSASVRD